MMKLLRRLFFLLLTLLASEVYSQVPNIEQYSEDPVKFLDEVEQTFEYAFYPKRELRDYMNRFAAIWNSPRYNQNFKNATYNTFNLMLRKKVKILPSYEIYLNSVINFIESNQNEASFEAWQSCVVNTLYNESVRNFTNFLEVSENLFLDNIFYKTAAYQYKSTKGGYKFEYDKGSRIIFSEMNIICYNSQKDSIVIYDTKGTYYPNDAIFKAKGGKVNWVRAGFSETAVWAELKQFEIDLKRGGYTADSATFYNKEYFSNKSFKGQLVDKVVSEKGKNISYPRFESYDKKIEVIDITKNVDYKGGIFMRGDALQGLGDKSVKASIVFKKAGQPFIVVKATKFSLSRTDQIESELAHVVIYMNQDSIYHPAISFKYRIPKNELSILRIAKGISKTPFYDSYHKINMYFEQMLWDITRDTLKMRMVIGNISEGALFESEDFFRVENYDALKGMDLISQLNSLRDFMKKNGGENEFTGDEYGHFMKSDPKYLLPALVHLAGFGFLTYDGDTDIIHANKKVSEYIDSYTKKSDYDVLLFSSFTNGGLNAELNMKNYDMMIYGVKQVYLSDSQNVTVFPAEQKVLLKQNRNFDFRGVVKAGRFTMFGNDFKFDYDKFIIYLNNVDSVRMKAIAFEEDVHGERPLMNVTSVLQKLNGTLEIDNPNNKSGVKPYSKFPIFNSFTNSYVYYDKKYIQRGLYTKDKFYFYLDPFTIDSLDNFTNAGINFPGELNSGGIFPKMRESLGLQPDYSLGFKITTPPEGLPLYGGKATYSNVITLNNKGLGGDGTLKYVTSETKSNAFVFMPDSTNALAQSFDVMEQQTKPEFPQAHGEEVTINFRPFKDQMRIWNSKDKRIALHNTQSSFDGMLTLTPKILRGNGLSKFGAGNLRSNNITYASSTIDADTSNFSLQGDDFSLKDALSFATENVKAHVDFKTRKGDFVSNGKGSIVKFPIIQYICFMQSFTWYMDNDDIEFGSAAAKAAAEGKNPKDINLKSLEFISTHPKQDSLRFEAYSAKFNPRKNIINAAGVDYINAADALIYPDSGKVYIEKNAAMRNFSNAKISANSITKLHNLYNCNVSVTGRKKYSGDGYYDYIDENKKKQTFYFKNISVDTSIQTYAETDIPEALEFRLNPYFEYKGKVKLQASKNFLVFDGYTRLTHQCGAVPKTWFNFESEINPEAVYIPIAKEPEGTDGSPIAASVMVSKFSDSIFLYPAFLSAIKSKSDMRVLSADGFIFYDKPSKEYRISNKEKLVEMSLPGNYLSLDTKNYCKVYGEGNITVGTSFGQVNVGTFGNVTHQFDKDETAFDMIMYFDFFFDENAIEVMGKNMAAFKGLTSVDFSRPVFEKGIREIMGKEEADKLISQLNLYGSYKKMPEQLRKTIFLTDLKMKWDKNTNSFTSVGQIGVGSINKIQINKMVDGQVEITKQRGGDVINIYLELDDRNWYYFNYNRGTMVAVSSSNNFNDILKDLKPDKRKQEIKGLPDYYFNICPPSKKTQFLRRNAAEESTEE